MKHIFQFSLLSFFLSFTAAAEVTAVKPSKAVKLMKKDPKIEVIDIRTPEEFKAGHLKGAKNIDFRSEDFEKHLAKLDRSKTYLMHCKSGGRSTASLKVWEKLGFKKVLHLDTGVLGWQKAELPLVKSKEKEKKK